jgi:hypothetical protein
MYSMKCVLLLAIELSILRKKGRSDENEKMKISLCLKTDSNLNIGNQNNEIIVPKQLKLKNSKKVIHKQITSTTNGLIQYDV